MKNKHDFPVSFEVFPANSVAALQKLKATCETFNTLDPRFISVTYGAAGASQLKTVRFVQQLIKQAIPTTPHISCVGMTKKYLETLLNKYMQYGINKLVVIRGDVNHPNQPNEFPYAIDLISYIRKITHDHFQIIIAAYPEAHPEAANSEMDFLYFQQKVDAGANAAITQFFFNTEAYYQFKERCLKANIHIPIIPGIMPIHDYGKLIHFSKACGAEIPRWLRKQLDSFLDDIASLKSKGIELITNLCERLLLEGAEGLHFYTLNQVSPTIPIYRRLFNQTNNVDFFDFMYAS